jgi:uncharacterized phage-associated protein
MHDALAIANEFLKLNGGPMNQMKLQKLVYMAHGWNLAINNAPLVRNAFEAWDGGPVVRTIWNHFRDHYFSKADGLLHPPLSSEPYRARVLPQEMAIITRVWGKYRDYTGLQLSRMTHQPGTPWANTYFRDGRNCELSQDDIKQHFRELAFAGRKASA